MTGEEFWQLFWETGAPEAYLLYSRSKRTEQNYYVSDDQSTGAAGNGLQ